MQYILLSEACILSFPDFMMHFYQFSFVYSAENAYLCLQETINQKIMSKFINPFTDVGFKRIFGQEINKDLLIDFLNAL